MIAAILQARVGSTRLPGKVLKPILGKPMLLLQLERLKRSKKVDMFVVATTNKPEDDPVVKLAERAGVTVFRGSESDVLDRYYKAAKEARADVIVRVTGDCPLHDPAVIDLVIERFETRGVDDTWTPVNYPEGLDTEVFTFSALEVAAREARLPSEREHVTLYLRNHPERFKLDEKWTLGDFDHSAYHWSVDTERDFAFVTAVYEHFGHNRFTVRDCLELLERCPELLEINRGGTGWEGIEESKREDEEWLKNHGPR
ncbi:glycosyltransferase family protein [Candidatus Kaiserbacteria bacterium]|nr:glycosyltransferase family protein [Candidatus Kaiserbacteria bacterium]